MNYLKYYFLEDYLFGEVRNNFFKRGYLLPDEFFCIIIWKANRRKTIIRKKFSENEIFFKKQIREITEKIYNGKTKKEKLNSLLEDGLKYGFRLPIASAILTVLYPEEFTIYDYRVLDELNKIKKEKITDFSYNLDVVNKYFIFLEEIKKISENKKLSLRDMDRYLWGKSFYKDIEKLIKG